jgi:PST family polysaccharide transporter
MTRTQLMRNQAALAMQYLANALIPLFLVPLVLRAIGVEAFGLLSIAFSAGVYAALLVNYGFNFAAVPRLARARSVGRRRALSGSVVRARFALLACVVGLLWLVIGSMAMLGRSPTSAQILVVAAMPIATALNMTWYLQGVERFGAIAWLSAVSAVLALCFGYFVLTAEGGGSDFFAGVALVFAPVLNGILSAVIAWRDGAFEATFRRWRSVGSELRKGRDFFLSQIVASLYGASGTLCIAAISGAAAAGAYAVTERAVNAVSGACLLAHAALFPTLARCYSHDRPEYFRFLRWVVVAYLVSSGLVCAALAVMWPHVLWYLYGASAQEYSLLLGLSLVWMVSMLFGTLLTSYLSVAGRADETLPITLRALVVVFGIGVPGVLWLGASGWVIAMLTGQVMVGFIAWRAIREDRV